MGARVHKGKLPDLCCYPSQVEGGGISDVWKRRLKRRGSLREGETAVNEKHNFWAEREAERTSRNRGPGEGGRGPRRPARLDGADQSLPGSRSGGSSNDATQLVKGSRSGGLFKSPFPTQPAAPTRRPIPESAPYEGQDHSLISNGTEQGFHPRGAPGEMSSAPGPHHVHRSISRPREETSEGAFEDLEEMPRPPKRPHPLKEERTPARQRRRPKEGDTRLAGELPIPSGRTGRRPKTLILKGALAFFLLMTCSSGSIVFLKIYHYYTFAKGATGQVLPTLTTNSGTKIPQATPLPSDLTRLDHFNMLLLGSDNDTKFASGAVLTQTDIVVRVDIKNQKITMVSIPRDFYINNDYGHCCYKLDEISGNETDGASTPLDAKKHGFAHTVATIEADFGIPISAYAWVGLDGFVKVIDTLGGVDVDVLHPIVDDAYPNDVNNADPYSYKRLDIPAGPQHLDGQTALEYVRSRHSDLTGDFGRSARQQSVLLALKKKLEDPAIFTKLDQFADDLQGSVLTSLSIGQVLELANFAKGLKSSSFQQVVLGAPTYAYNETITTAGGTTKSVVQPDWTAINKELPLLFPDSSASNNINLKVTEATDKQTIQAENAPIVVENGTNTAGVAAKLEAILKGQGFNVIGAQSANSSNVIQTQVQYFDPKGPDGTSFILGNMLGVPPLIGISPPPGAQIVIVIGTDTAQAIMQA